MTKATGAAKSILSELSRNVYLPHELQLRRLRLAMEELSPCQRQALEDYYFRDMKQVEIAKSRGVGRSTVCRTLQRARKNLGRLLKY